MKFLKFFGSTFSQIEQFLNETGIIVNMGGGIFGNFQPNFLKIKEMLQKYFDSTLNMMIPLKESSI